MKARHNTSLEPTPPVNRPTTVTAAVRFNFDVRSLRLCNGHAGECLGGDTLMMEFSGIACIMERRF